MSKPMPANKVTPFRDERLLNVEGLEKTYSNGGQSLTVLKGLDMQLSRGEMVALVGPSGAGKSTLLHIIGLLDSPSAGRITVAGRDASTLDEQERTMLRRQMLGFVYQFHYLQPEFSAIENAAMPLIIAGKSRKDAHARAAELLGELGLSHRLDHRPARLSGGEQQRVAIARALAGKPQMILADEPTGNLDPETSAHVFDMLIGLVRKSGIGALIATHNPDLAKKMDRVVELKDGALIAR